MIVCTYILQRSQHDPTNTVVDSPTITLRVTGTAHVAGPFHQGKCMRRSVIRTLLCMGWSQASGFLHTMTSGCWLAATGCRQRQLWGDGDHEFSLWKVSCSMILHGSWSSNGSCFICLRLNFPQTKKHNDKLVISWFHIPTMKRYKVGPPNKLHLIIVIYIELVVT